MGAAQSSSYLTPEAAATALVVAGAVALGYTQLAPSSSGATTAASAGKEKKRVKAAAQTGTGDPSDAPSTSGATKKGKKKAKVVAAAAGPGSPGAPSFAEVAKLPGGFEDSTGSTLGAVTEEKKPKKKGKAGKGAKDEVSTSAREAQTVPVVSPESVSASIDFLSASEIEPKAGKKGKKGKKATARGTGSGGSTPATSQTLPSSASASTSAQKSGGKTKGTSASGTMNDSAKPTPKGTPAPPLVSLESPKLSRPTPSTTSIDTDGSWTQVSSGKGRNKNPGQPAAGDTTPSGTAESSPAVSISRAAGQIHELVDSRSSESDSVNEEGEEEEEEEAHPGEAREFLLSAAARASSMGERRTLAERLLPKPRKTGVEDMLTTSDHPSLARVMRVTPLPNEKPAEGFSWGDYEDVGEPGDEADEGGWVVQSSKKSKRPLNASGSLSSSTPAPGSTSEPSKAPETLSKKQRQNRKAAELKKAVKADQAAAQQAALNQHRHELEHERMKEQLSSGKGRGKVSGGMVASVDSTGRLVWD